MTLSGAIGVSSGAIGVFRAFAVFSLWFRCGSLRFAVVSLWPSCAFNNLINNKNITNSG